MVKKAVVVLVLFAVVCGLAYAGFNLTNGTVLAKVGSEVITETEFNARVKTFPDQFKDALEKKENKEIILDQMIDELLLLNAAKVAKYSKSEEYKEQVKNAKKQILLGLLLRDKVDSKISLNETDLQQYYNSNENQFGAIEQRNASHILVKTELTAKRLIRELNKGASFENLAKENSLDPGSKDKGGSIGWFAKGQLVKEFENAVYSIKSKGKITGPVKTQFGYHIIKLNDINIRPKVEYQQARAQIQQLLVNEKKRALTQDLLGELKSEFKIKKDLEKIN